MYINKKGTVLISTVIILSLMSFLGCFIFKMMKNNNEIGSLYTFNKDIYDLDKKEEEILNEFMKELNKIRADKLNDQHKENNNKEEKSEEGINKAAVLNEENLENKIIKDKSDKEDIFSENFQKEIKDSILEYHKNDHKLYLITSKDNKINRKREIKYIFRNDKVILVPTYKFDDNSE